MNKLTKAELLEFLEFDEELSRFRWKTRPGEARGVKIFNTRYAGKLAGTLKKRGSGLIHRVIYTGRLNFFEHRLVWLYHYVELPKTDLDHLNGDGLDNRINNLRAVTGGENLKNLALSKNNTSGHTGVVWHKRDGRYMVQVSKGGKCLFGGYFAKEDLHLAVAKAKEIRASLGFSPTHGLTREQRKAAEID